MSTFGTAEVVDVTAISRWMDGLADRWGRRALFPGSPVERPGPQAVVDVSGEYVGEIARAPADRLIARAPAGVESLLLLRASSRPGYLLDGPFRWPAQPATYVIAPRWRRTIRGRQPRDGAGTITWVPGREDDRRDAWPACAWLDDES